MVTTLLAVTVGLILVNLFTPGVGVKLAVESTLEGPPHTVPSVVAIFTDIVPKNLFAAMANDKILSIIFFSLLFGVALSSVGEKAQPIVNLFKY